MATNWTKATKASSKEALFCYVSKYNFVLVNWKDELPLVFTLFFTAKLSNITKKICQIRIACCLTKKYQVKSRNTCPKLINDIVATYFSYLSMSICNLDWLLKAVWNINGLHHFQPLPRAFKESTDSVEETTKIIKLSWLIFWQPTFCIFEKQPGKLGRLHKVKAIRKPLYEQRTIKQNKKKNKTRKWSKEKSV